MKQKTINELFIRICDKFPVENKFDFDQEIVAILKGSIVNKQIKNNQDGSVDIILTLKASDYDIQLKS